MNKENFGEFVCTLRKEKGMTQQELGDKLHITNKAISKWERGLSFPDICILQEVAQVLEVSVFELLNADRNTEIVVTNEVANKIIEDTVKDSGQLIKKLRMKLSIVTCVIIGSLPLLLMVLSLTSFYLIKDEKSLDEALFTLLIIFIGALLLFVGYGIAILGIAFVKMWSNSHFMSNNNKMKKIICAILYFIFSTWLILNIIRVINNMGIYGL